MEETLVRIREWAQSRHTRVIGFAVCRREDGQRLEGVFATLEEARREAREQAGGPFGCRPAIYALTPEGWAQRVEEVEID